MYNVHFTYSEAISLQASVGAVAFVIHTHMANNTAHAVMIGTYMATLYVLSHPSDSHAVMFVYIYCSSIGLDDLVPCECHIHACTCTFT